MTTTDWDNLFKVKISNIVDESMDKHDIVKLLLVRKILRKYKQRTFIRIYTEKELSNGTIPDVYFEDIKNKAIVCYEIQKELTNEYTRKKVEQYKNYEVPYMTCDLVIIPLKDAPTHISELNKWLDKYIY
jgi:hypothetical protein